MCYFWLSNYQYVAAFWIICKVQPKQDDQPKVHYSNRVEHCTYCIMLYNKKKQLHFILRTSQKY